MTSSCKFSLNIITALNCEAKPLIDFYRLSKQRSRPFDYYRGKSQTASGRQFSVNLLVSGLGKSNMAVACGWLAAQSDKLQSAWLNIGTAGHKDLDVGCIVRVNRAVDIASGKSQYPSMTAKWSKASRVLISYDSECIDYPEDALVDMEGAAFFSSAGMFVTSELVQSLKIVSDNQTNSIERLNAALISDLIAPQVPAISDFAIKLIDLIPQAHNVSVYLPLIEHLHSTVSQRQQYFDVLSKLQSLDQLDVRLEEEINNASSMSILINSLKKQLQTVQPNLAMLAD